MSGSLLDQVDAVVREAGIAALRFPEAEDLALRQGIDEIVSAYPGRFAGGAAVRFMSCPRSRGLSVKVVPGGVEINYSRLCEAFRALGIVMGRLESGLELENYAEESAFETLGVMVDVSRNGVLRVEAVKKMIRHFALMGLNQLMLYTEDTYEIPGEPLFGYFRGGYSQKELAAIDDYASLFGMEVVPCIQTLGHLEQVLQWPSYRPMQDTAGVLLAGDAAAERLVEKMIAAASAPFRSKRIHIGMDEAHGIGSGQYRFRNGLKPPFEILTSHLERVAEICRREGLTPMIWSDMFFRLGSRSGQYYDRGSQIPEAAAKQISEEVQVVYWDYYHTDTAFYDDWIARHRAMGKEPVFAAGIWTWNRSWAALPHSFATIGAGMGSARRNGLKEAFVTMWGDNGAECDFFSALPAVQFFAEMAYAPKHAEAALKTHFRGSCAASSAAWIDASRLDCIPGTSDPREAQLNPSKWLLWHDPILNFLERHIPETLPGHYAGLATLCTERATAETEDARLGFAGKLAAVLSRKAALHLQLRPAYRNGDAATLRRIAEELIPTLHREVRDLWKADRERWHAQYKPFGWEILEGRYGALLARMETLREKLADWLADPSRRIEELECESCEVYPSEEWDTLVLNYHNTCSPSRVY